MDDTASFSSRSNAKRAAEKMIANGAAPAVDYGFKPRDDGRFEIVWKTDKAKANLPVRHSAASDRTCGSPSSRANGGCRLRGAGRVAVG